MFAPPILVVIRPVDVSRLALIGIYVLAIGIAAAGAYLVLSHLILWARDRKEATERSKDAPTGKTFGLVAMGILLVVLLGALVTAMVEGSLGLANEWGDVQGVVNNLPHRAGR